jgi:hypothetical protein
VKKIILGILSAIIAIAMFIPMATEVFAADGKALDIEAADSIKLNTSVTIKVIDQNDAAVSKASVYVLEAGYGSANNNRGSNAPLQDYAQLAEDNGTLIGKTSTLGKVTYTFTDAGNYILVAIKTGYLPATEGITAGTVNDAGAAAQHQVTNADFRNGNSNIRNASVTEDNLVIKAANRAELKTTVSISVVDGDNEAITKAAVYVVDSADIRSGNGNRAADYADLAEDEGKLIGKTNSNGVITYKFTTEGNYSLIALKDGYTPAIHEITAGDAENVNTMNQQQPVNASNGPDNNIQMQNNNGQANGQNNNQPINAQNNNQQGQQNNNAQQMAGNNRGFFGGMGDFFNNVFNNARKWMPWENK